MSKVFIIGAADKVGRLVSLLANRGHQPMAMLPNSTQSTELKDLGDTAVTVAVQQLVNG